MPDPSLSRIRAGWQEGLTPPALRRLYDRAR
jgi:hypothetical protein